MADVTTDAPSVPAGDFAADTAVTPVPGAPGTFTADLSEAWKVFYAFGGATMAVALRAAQAGLDREDLAPVSATAVYAAPVPCGEMTIDTRILRAGRSAAQVTADLRAGGADERAGETDLHLTAIFGAPHESRLEFCDVTYPEDALPLAESVPPDPMPADSPFAAINYHHQTEWLPARPGGGFRGEGWEPGGPARALAWHRLKETPRLADGTVDPIAYCLPADVIGPAIVAKIGPEMATNPPLLMLSLEISLQFVATTTSPWLLQHTRAHHSANGYAWGSVELWGEDRQLLAFGTQRAHVRPVDISRFAPGGGTA